MTSKQNRPCYGCKDRLVQFSVDNLEQRRMLAGEVTTTLAGGSLTISGDGQDNILAAAQVNGSLALIGVDTTIADADVNTDFMGIDLSIKLIGGITKDVTAILRGGDDAFLIGGRADGVDLTDPLGSDDVTFGPATLPRDLKIFTNGGRDLVVVTGAEVDRDVLIDTGFGLNDTVIVGGGGVAVATLDLLQELDTGDLPLLSATEGGGDGVLGEILGAVLGPVDVGRDLRISGESSDDAIYVGGASIGRDAIIHSNIGEDRLYFGTGALVEVFGEVTQLGLDSLGLDGLGFEVSAEVSVGRNAMLHTGDGDDVAWVGGQRLFSFDLGEPEPELGGDDYFLIGLGGGVSVEENLTLNVSAHDDSAYVGVRPRSDFDFDVVSQQEGGGPEFNVTVGRDANLLTMADDDYLQVGGTLGQVSEEFFFPGMEGVLRVGRDLNIHTAAGTDQVVLGETDPVLLFHNFGGQLLAESGGDTFYLIEVNRDLDIDTGTHDDQLLVGGFPFIFDNDSEGEGLDSIGNLRVQRDMDVNTSGGNDIFRLGFSEIGDDNGIGFNDSTAVYVGRDFDTRTGNQDDEVTIEFTRVIDDTAIRTSWGRDLLTIGTSGFGGSVIFGNRLNIYTSLERDTVAIMNTDIGGHALIDTNIRDDSVSLVDVSLGGNLRVNTNRGNDEVMLDNVSAVGDIHMNTQRENDDVHIVDTTADQLNLLAAADDDNVCVFDSMFVGGAILNGGAGEADGLSHNLGSPTIIGFEQPGDCA